MESVDRVFKESNFSLFCEIYIFCLFNRHKCKKVSLGDKGPNTRHLPESVRLDGHSSHS